MDAAITVRSVRGPGLLERAYQVCRAHALGTRALRVRVEVPMPGRYDGRELALADRIDRIDRLVEACGGVEIAAVAKILPVPAAQLLSPLKLSDHRVGLWITFNVARLNDGRVRMANRLSWRAQDPSLRQGSLRTLPMVEMATRWYRAAAIVITNLSFSPPAPLAPQTRGRSRWLAPNATTPHTSSVGHNAR